MPDTTPAPVQDTTVKQRLTALFELLLEDSTFNKPTKMLIQTLGKTFFTDKLTDEEIIKQVKYLRDEIIPMILGE